MKHLVKILLIATLAVISAQVFAEQVNVTLKAKAISVQGFAEKTETGTGVTYKFEGESYKSILNQLENSHQNSNCEATIAKFREARTNQLMSFHHRSITPAVIDGNTTLTSCNFDQITSKDMIVACKRKIT